jgi:hypothetical protein
MAYKFNPFTDTLDIVGSGGGSSYIDGVVADSSLLPVTVGTPALDAVYLAKAGSGVWLINRKPAGLYCRVANDGDLDDWTHLGAFPEVNADGNWALYNSATPSKELKFDLSGISASTVRTLTVPDASGTIARTEDFAAPPAIGSTTAAAGTFTTLTANNGTLTASAPVLDLAQTWNAGGTTFTGFKVTATDTTSAAASVIADFSLGSTSVFAVAKGGIRLRNGVGGTIDTFLETSAGGSGGDLIIRSSAGGSTFRFLSFGNECYCDNSVNQAWIFRAASAEKFRITNVGGIQLNANQVTLVPDAAATLAQRQGTTAQEFRIYNTFTSSTNYQRLTIKTKAVTLSGLTGASVATTTGLIPDGAVLVGLTTRVSTAITGATGYDIGDGSDADRWGANIGIALNTSSDNTNWTAGTIECFTAAQEVTLTAVGSNFTGGAVVIVAHYLAGEAD